ncbi:hypothetical protein TRVL_05935 [Trypanosoma vivax]|nr:hypothetical protein TRVL_05935 [Trypanosoma vivax]
MCCSRLIISLQLTSPTTDILAVVTLIPSPFRQSSESFLYGTALPDTQQAPARHQRPLSSLLHRTISGIPVSERAHCFAGRHNLIFTKCHTDFTGNKRGHAPHRTNKELLASNQTNKLRSATQHPVRLE